VRKNVPCQAREDVFHSAPCQRLDESVVMVCVHLFVQEHATCILAQRTVLAGLFGHVAEEQGVPQIVAVTSRRYRIEFVEASATSCTQLPPSSPYPSISVSADQLFSADVCILAPEALVGQATGV